jgi:hypothetical protein
VALPALVVLALVAVVAIASGGSSLAGNGEQRAPSAALLDTIFSIWLVALLAGAVLLVYGLMQRRAIANEIASGRVRRMSIVGYVVILVLFTAVSYWRLTTWMVHRQDPEEALIGGAAPGPTDLPQRPDVAYQPGISWIAVGAVLGLCIAAVAVYVMAERRARRRPARDRSLAQQLGAALDESLDDLRSETDPRRAVIAAYARLERVLAANGVPRRAAETPNEYLPRVLHDLELDPLGVERLTALYEQAKFSHHEVDTPMKENAVDALERVRDELRLTRAERERGITSGRAPAEAVR